MSDSKGFQAAEQRFRITYPILYVIAGGIAEIHFPIRHSFSSFVVRIENEMAPYSYYNEFLKKMFLDRDDFIA
ncbi:hypothetical protein JIR001_08180 [Polycladomyces abyssicola]|uniref:Uncharacterized protein n=1 Tax=Polycladomyces abyssicola TaxID=1125966 RepID=A0A8D5UDC6_9BACL|nr:hypothetical protein JIR001_08180 [Polycladomyces abyssicola]